MQTEVYGARLAAKYLDKELAGRIQQIQLLGRDMYTLSLSSSVIGRFYIFWLRRGAEHDRLVCITID
jgi:hypothetical protein